MTCWTCMGEHDPDGPCITAKAKPLNADTREDIRGAAFDAQYSGDCEGCDVGIFPGDRIRKSNHGYTHLGCETG